MLSGPYSGPALPVRNGVGVCDYILHVCFICSDLQAFQEERGGWGAFHSTLGSAPSSVASVSLALIGAPLKQHCCPFPLLESSMSVI